MCLNHSEQPGILHQALQHLTAALFKILNFFCFRCGRIIEIDIILMRAETSLFYQLRNRDFLVDISAHIHVARPHRRRGIIGRGSGQGNGSQGRKLRLEGFEGFPPFAAKMMAFVEAKQFDVGIFHGSN